MLKSNSIYIYLKDGNSTGVVVGFGNGGWVNIHWTATNLNETYRSGFDGKHDVQKAPPTPNSSGGFQLGSKVVRGVDWHYGTQVFTIFS